jgi:VWFA-related protein
MKRYTRSFLFRSVSSLFVALLILLCFGLESPLFAQRLTDYRYTKEGIQIGYKQRSGDTEVNFTRPPETDLPPQLVQAWRSFRPAAGQPSHTHFGKAKVETKGYGTEIEATNFILPCPAENITSGLNTYVLWVVNPSGAVENKSEIQYDDNLGGSVQDTKKANALTTQPIFAMMVTAEPHFAVLSPSRYVVLVSQPLDNRKYGLGDSIVFNPSAAPFEVDPNIKANIGNPFDVRDSKSEKIRQVRNTLNQAQYSIAMAETVIKNIEDVVAANIKPALVESEQLLGPVGRASFVSFKETVLKRLLENNPVEFAKARSALEEAKKFYRLAAQGHGRLSTSSAREEMLPISLQARFAVQAGTTALIFANYAFAKVELSRARVQISLFIKLGDELSEELRYLSGVNSEIEGKLKLRDAKIGRLEDYKGELDNYVSNLGGYADTLNSQINIYRVSLTRLKDESGRLRSELDQICESMSNLIGTLGTITQTDKGIIIRLKSDILFQPAEFLFDDCSGKDGAKTATEEAFDYVVEDALLRKDLADAQRNNDTAAVTRIQENRIALAVQKRKDVRPVLAQLSTLLRILYGNATFKFVGHTDTKDAPEYNQWLSEQRALEVARVFFAQQLELMPGDDKRYQEYLDIIRTANLLLYKRKSNSDKYGFSQYWPMRGGTKPGGNIKADSKQLQDRVDRLRVIEKYVEGRGEQQLIVPTPDDTDEPRNRRVEIEITTTEQTLCNLKTPEVATLPTIGPLPPRPAPPDFPVGVATEEISFPLSVLDSRSLQNITDLNERQIKVYDCAEPCNDRGEVQEFRLRKANQPLRVALLIDEGVNQQLSLEQERTAAARFLQDLMDEQNQQTPDKVAILSFSRSTTYRQTLTSERPALLSALDAIRPNSLINGLTPNIFIDRDDNGSALFDAVLEGSLALTAGEPYKNPISQKIIVLLSDGNDTASISRLKDVVQRAVLANVRVYAIGIPGRALVDGREVQFAVKEERLRDLCDKTGGRFFPSSTSLQDAFNQIKRDLRIGYVVTYDLKDNRKKEVYHQIRVEGPADYRFFHRKLYYDR